MDKETILIVDDNPQLVDFYRTRLLPELGYDSHSASSGKAALNAVTAREYSLMLLDYRLPDMSGLDILKKLAGTNHRIPVILLTAHGSEDIAAEAFRLGAQDYLTKPVDSDRLSLAISRVLSESRLQQERNLLNSQLKEQLSWQNIIQQVGRSLTASLDVDDVLKRIIEASVFITQAEEGFLALLDESSGQLYLRAVKNMDQEKSKTMRLPVQDPLIGKAFKTQRPIRTTARSPQEELIKLSTGYLVYGLLHVPIISKGRALGVLTVLNHSITKSFKVKDEILLTSLADYAAVALENANLYEEAQKEIQQRRRIEEALRQSEERYSLATRGANDGLWDWDLKTTQIYFSPRWKTMLGLTEAEVTDNPEEWFNRVHPEDIEKVRLAISAHLEGTTAHFESEHRMAHKDGSYLWVLNRGLAVWDENRLASRFAGSQTDITHRKYAEEKLLHDAFYDTLTGLPNRALFLDHLTLAVERSKRRQDYAFAVLFMDVDRFKDVNDSYGHLIGDSLLRAIAQRLEQRIRTTDTVARLGGDEFVILLDEINSTENVTQVAMWILQEFTEPFQISNHDISVTTSIGIVLSQTGYQRSEEVLRDVDIALYHAKANGKSHFEVFTPRMREQVMERLALENDLRRAIANEEFSPHYQLIISLATGNIVGVEALARWNHPKRGLLLPREFIPVAEETGMVVQIDRTILKQACAQLRLWQLEIPKIDKLTVSVNISAKHVSQPDLVDFIKMTLAENQLEPSSLQIEITETTLIEGIEKTNHTFLQLRELGIQLQIDDFGIGYSSLSYLSHYPIQALKIDRSFVSSLPEDSNNIKIIQAILMLSNRLNVGVIAEGVETETQLNQLKELGCEFAQGYFFSMPLDTIDLTVVLKEAYTGSLLGKLTLPVKQR